MANTACERALADTGADVWRHSQIGFMGILHLICCNFMLLRTILFFLLPLVVHFLQILAQFWRVVQEVVVTYYLELISSADAVHVGSPDTALHQHAVANLKVLSVLLRMPGVAHLHHLLLGQGFFNVLKQVALPACQIFASGM